MKPSQITVVTETGEIQVRSARSFQKPQTTKAVRLSRETRTKISRGDHPQLTFPMVKACPVESGDEIRITSLLHIEITKIKTDRMNQLYVVDYIEHNERPRLLRARAHAADFDAMKERIEGKSDSEKDELASEDSHYTTSTGSAMKGEPEAVPRRYQELLSEESHREGLRPWETARVEIEGQIARLEEDPLVGKRKSELKFLKTQLQRIDEKVRREAA